MLTDPQEPSFETVDENPLAVVPKAQPLEIVVAQSGLAIESANPIVVAFAPFMDLIEEWRVKCNGIRVTSADQKAEIEMAGIGRRKFKQMRCDAENTRKRLKEEIVKRGRFIDNCAGVIIGAIEPLEQHLKAQEEFVQRIEQARRTALLVERTNILLPYGVDTALFNLVDMPEETFNRIRVDAKIAHEAKIEAARKAETDRLARIESERAERERLRVENERLKVESQMREKAIVAERAKALAEQIEKDKTAKVERERLEAVARQEREAREKVEREAREKAAREAETARKAAAAPDKEKLVALGKALAAIDLPLNCTTAAGRDAVGQVQHGLMNIQRTLAERARSL